MGLALGALVIGLLLVGGVLKLFHLAGLTWPLVSSWPREQLPLWMLYQFTHVALPEEFFFRGYLQGELVSLFKARGVHAENRSHGTALVLAAGLFAACHAVIWGAPGALLTFFPGLVMGWLYWKSDSLLAPILFHGCANIGYAWLGG
jgi:membrane protease YdiL (CAAX protease family)